MRTITEKTKVNVYKSILHPILTYGCKSWLLTKNIGSRIQTVEMKYLRWIKGIRTRDRVRNEVVRQELKVEPILKKIHKQQFKWFGHLMKMNDSRLVKKVWHARMTERKRGRPRKTSKNSVADILREKNVTWNGVSKKVRNRKKWAKFKFVHEWEEQYLTPQSVKQNKDYNNNKIRTNFCSYIWT